MKHIYILTGALLLAPFVSLHAASDSVETELRAMQSKLSFIPLGEFLYHREPRDYSSGGKLKNAWSVLLRLDSLQCDVPELEVLSHHAEADIRTLSLLAMVAKETPEVVPACLRLMNDKASTLPNCNDAGGLIPGGHVITSIPQTVSDVARAILTMVGCRIFMSKDATKTQADEWWVPRRGNLDWLAWHGFLYNRATQGTTPVRPESKEAIQRFREGVDALPATTRSWVLLYLADEVFASRGIWEDYFATEKEMTDAVKALGADALIEFLKTGKRMGLSEPSLDDPEKGRRFIITYAPHFFTRQNADALLKLKLYTAASDADPSRVRRLAEDGLRENSGKYQEWDRAKVMAALASLGDGTDRATAVNWFYDEPNRQGGSTSQSIFIHEIGQRRPGQWRDVARSIIARPAFDLLAPIDVMHLALMIEKLGGGTKLITPGYRYEENADATRDLLRDMFQIKQNAVIRIKPPGNYLQEPEWKTELDETASSFDLSINGEMLAIGFEEKGQGVRIIGSERGAEIARVPALGKSVRVTFVTGRDTMVGVPDAAPDMMNIKAWSRKQGGETSYLLQSPSSVHPSRRGDRVAKMVGGETLAWAQSPGGNVLWEEKYPNCFSSAFQISPDASLIACNDGWSKVIEIIHTADGKHEPALSGHASSPSKLAFSRDSKMLISTGDDNRVIIWSLSEGKRIATYSGGNVRFGPVAFSSDAQSFFASPSHGELASYSVAKGEAQFGIKFTGNRIAAAIPSSDGKHLFLMIRHSGSNNFSASPIKTRIECWKLP